MKFLAGLSLVFALALFSSFGLVLAQVCPNLPETFQMRGSIYLKFYGQNRAVVGDSKTVQQPHLLGKFSHIGENKHYEKRETQKWVAKGGVTSGFKFPGIIHHIIDGVVSSKVSLLNPAPVGGHLRAHVHFCAL